MASLIANPKQDQSSNFLQLLQPIGDTITLARVIGSWVGHDRTVTVIRPERRVVTALCQIRETMVGMAHFQLREVETAYGRLFKPNKLVDRFSDQPGYVPNEQMHHTRDQRLGIRWGDDGYGWCPPKAFLQLVISYGCTKLSQATVRQHTCTDGRDRYVADLMHATDEGEIGWSETIGTEIADLQALAAVDGSQRVVRP